jgi:hypothetical protein
MIYRLKILSIIFILKQHNQQQTSYIGRTYIADAKLLFHEFCFYQKKLVCKGETRVHYIKVFYVCLFKFFYLRLLGEYGKILKLPGESQRFLLKKIYLNDGWTMNVFLILFFLRRINR